MEGYGVTLSTAEAIAAIEADHRGWGLASLTTLVESGRVTPETLRELLLLTWGDTGANASRIAGNFTRGRDADWLTLFRTAGYTTDSDEELPVRLTVFRGVGDPNHWRGVWWTRSLPVAEAFAWKRAREDHGDAWVYEATIDREAILACLRFEEQVVIGNPALILDVRGRRQSPQMRAAFDQLIGPQLPTGVLKS